MGTTDKQIISLSQLQQKIKDVTENAFPYSIWFTAEIAEIKESYNGHCYLDLIDYKATGTEISAKIRASIWASAYRMIKAYFISQTGQALQAGMRVLLKAQVQYSLLYGLNLSITDIDPSFTLGEMELKRQQTINRLKEEGMFDMNRTLHLARLPRNLAIISSESAAGYRDFIKHLHQNEYGFSFNTVLFPSPMQGSEAPSGIIAALEQIADNLSGRVFDAVIIIRGGGSSIDLSCFDDYSLAANIAQFPLPVITGLGHDHDYHIADMVANTYLKTPTAVADFILDISAQEDAMLNSLKTRLAILAKYKIEEQKNRITSIKIALRYAANRLIDNNLHKLETYKLRLNAINPQTALDKGFIIVEVNGLRANSADDFKDEDKVSLFIKKKKVEFIIKNVKKF